MGKKERYSALNRGFLVNEMDVEASEAVHLDGCLEIREFIDLSFCVPPVIFFSPVLSQTFDIGQWSAIIPASFIELIREVGV